MAAPKPVGSLFLVGTTVVPLKAERGLVAGLFHNEFVALAGLRSKVRLISVPKVAGLFLVATMLVLLDACAGPHPEKFRL